MGFKSITKTFIESNPAIRAPDPPNVSCRVVAVFYFANSINRFSGTYESYKLIFVIAFEE